VAADLDHVLAQWARVGIGVDVAPHTTTPDLERLILQTAECAAQMPRLFILAATWLHGFGELVAKHRLRGLVRREMHAHQGPVLGLLLSIAQDGTHPPRFASVLRDLHAEPDPRPLFDIERSNPLLAARAARRASALSRRWGVWCEEFEFKDDALRPASWMFATNPELVARADFRGDLRASVLAALRHDADAGHSELELARRAGGSRAQVRAALDNLELTGKARRIRVSQRHRTRIELGTAST
jgi:hypothetical protein